MWKVLVAAGLLGGAAASSAQAADYERERYAPRPRVRALCEVNASALVLGCPPQIIAPEAIADDLRRSYLELSPVELRRPYSQTYTWTR